MPQPAFAPTSAEQERPPYVKFEAMPMEDRDATIANGYYTERMVDFALITARGSKDIIPREVGPWLADLKIRVQQERCPPGWPRLMADAYAAWKKDEEAPVDGISLQFWPGISKQQYRLLKEIHILSVEDLATANEESLGRIGMGARHLKNKAVEYLKNAKDNRAVEEVVGLRQRLAEQEATMQRMQAQMSAMAAAGGGARQSVEDTAGRDVGDSILDSLEADEPVEA